MTSKADLSGEVVALGVLLGILTESGDSVSVNTGWFSDPLGGLEGIPTRLDSLVTLIDDLLGPGVAYPIDGFPDAQWYPIPDITTGGNTIFHLVAPRGAPDSGQIGFGVRYSLTSDNLTYTAFGYIPLFSYSPSGTTFIAGNAQNPCQIGLSVSTSAPKGFEVPPPQVPPVQVPTVSFTALSIDARIYLAAQLPTINIEFANLTGTTKTGPFNTLASLLDPDVQAWIGEVIIQSKSWLNLTIGDYWVSVGDLLVAAGFLSNNDDGSEEDDEANYTLNLAELDGMSATQIALRFLFGVLDLVTETETPIAIIELPGGGLYGTRRAGANNSASYGIRLAFDIPLSLGRDASGKPRPDIDLTLGSWLSGEDEEKNWVHSSNGALTGVQEPGLSIYILGVDQQLNFSFAPSFALSSIGLNIEGGANTALVNLDGYTLQGAEVRAYLDSDGWVYGFAGRFDGIGFPLGPSFGAAVTGSNTNPVARSLLSSGSGGQGDQDPVNPAFSVSGAFVRGGSFVVQLYDKDDNPSDEVIIPIQRTLGPLRAEKLGIGWVQSDSMLSLLLDGGISLAGLNVDLIGLSIGVPLASPNDFSKYDLDLNGLSLLLNVGAVELSAGLVKLGPDLHATPPRNYTEYDGEAFLKAGTFAIVALGSYAYVPNPGGGGYASLFIFGILDADLGGPEFFFVTGLAAGFGYNRALILPDQNSVTQFPLVAAANDPAALGGVQQSDGSWQMPGPATALALLDKFVPPERGEYWLAAGIRFTSFDLINSTALLVVAFGDELEIALLALSWISLPPPPAPGASAPPIKYAYAELGIEIKLLPSEGVFSATAILTPNSFVIDPACKLTGGFAFYVWFGGNAHAGQFVLTLGGYHPDFKPPSYYPTVPPLGFNWPVSSEVSISGAAYFALTPSAAMAGAGLHVLFNSGNLHAWFNAQMDALVEWAPFHYLIDIGVNVGASYKLHLLFVSVTMKVELGADLTIWGPPMGGRAHIDWYVISFTISFGADQQTAPPPLDWSNEDGTGFAQTLLPHKTATKTMPAQATEVQPGPMAAAAAPASVQPSGVYTIAANDGLLKTFTSNGDTIWVVRPNHFIFSTLTAIPATEVDITPVAGEAPGVVTKITAQSVSPDGENYSVNIRPMKATLASSIFTITLTNDDEKSTYDLAAKFDYDVALGSVPAAKWGQPLANGQQPEANALVGGRLLGLKNITPKAPVLTPNGSDALTIDVGTAFTYDVVDQEQPYNPDYLPLQPGQTPVGPVPQASSEALQQIAATLMQPPQVSARNDIFTALQEYGIDPGTNGALANLANGPGLYLSGSPLLVGSTPAAGSVMP